MLGLAIVVACLPIVVLDSARPAAGTYPLTLMADAQAKTATTTISTTLKIQVDRLVEESRQKRVTDALMHGGFNNFMQVFRQLPPIGSISVENRMVDIRYATESQDEKGRRLMLVADKPLFFLGNETQKSRAGFELTVVQLVLDAKGEGSGTICGAAKIKPTPDGGVEMSEYAQTPVELKVKS
jgi:hypothetical protein